MTLRERILSVYRGEQPDVVPCMLDLSHWFYHKHQLPWDLSAAYEEPEGALIDHHRRLGVGFYMPNLAPFYASTFPGDVIAETTKAERNGQPEIAWRLETPIGAIERRRVWEPQTYAWGISRWGVRTEQDLRVLDYAMSRRTHAPKWDVYQAWSDRVGDTGVVYLSAGYSALGHLMHYWMGFEELVFAMADFPGLVHEVVDHINDNQLHVIDLLAQSPAEIVIMGDNFSSDMQPPAFFEEWSAPYYREAVRRLHAAGKYVAVHIDGRLKGAIAMIRDTGADCGDAITPAPMGDLSADACREEAGPNFILSGGVSPELWLPSAPEAAFRRYAIEWLELRAQSPRLIAGAGDQVPPGAVEDRIEIMRDLVEEHGSY